MIYQAQLDLSTDSRQAINITELVNQKIKTSTIEYGLCHLFTPHTSAGLIIAPNQDDNVLLDLEDYLQKLVPDEANYRHHHYPADMAGHIRSLILGCEKTIPIKNKRLNLGTVQSIFFYEFTLKNDKRKINLTIYG